MASSTLGARVGQWASVALTLGSGVALTLFAYGALRDRDRTARQASIEGRAAGLVARLRETLETPIESANSLAGLFGASNLVERDEFARFVGAALHREPLIHALEFAPKVTGDQRERFETEVRATGLSDYEIRELSTSRRLVRSSVRDTYVPLLYIEPSAPAFGFDIASQPTRRALLQRACSTATPVASGRTRLVEDSSQQLGVMVYVPTWARGTPPKDLAQGCDQAQGYVVLVFQIEPIVTAVMRDVPLGDLELAVLDLDAPQGERILGESSAAAAGRIAASAERERRSLQFVDRTWAVEVAPRGPRSSIGATAVLVLGLLVSMLAAVLAGGAGLVSRLRRRVRQATQLGQYVLEEELGRGGMGIVYRARHVMMRRPTALKLLLAGVDKPGHEAQFEREVQLTSKLTHPNTIAIYDYGRTAEGTFYYVMEYVDGIAFSDLIEHDGAQPVARTLHLIRQVLVALREAHSIGLIHRDLTPSNLMISVRGGVADFVKVLDFGLVKEMSSEDLAEQQPSGGRQAVEKGGRFFGTAGYAPPEVLVGEVTDPRSDLYSVGAIWFALLTGRRTFDASGATAIFAAQMQQPPQRVSQLQPDVPAVIDALIDRCLARDPRERPASAQEILDQLDASDLPRWSGEEASAWWRERAPRVQAATAQQRARVRSTDLRTGRTVVIALGRRDRHT